jgi:type III secretory pathway lipoprotein EscJ
MKIISCGNSFIPVLGTVIVNPQVVNIKQLSKNSVLGLSTTAVTIAAAKKKQPHSIKKRHTESTTTTSRAEMQAKFLSRTLKNKCSFFYFYF